MRTVEKSKRPARRRSDPKYRLLHVAGCVEPALVGPVVKSWDALGEEIVKFLKKGSYNADEDGLFVIQLSGSGRLESVDSFTGGYMDDLRKQAGLGEGV